MQRGRYKSLQIELPVVIPARAAGYSGKEIDKWVTGRSHVTQMAPGVSGILRLVARKEVRDLARTKYDALTEFGWAFLGNVSSLLWAMSDNDELAIRKFFTKLLLLHERAAQYAKPPKNWEHDEFVFRPIADTILQNPEQSSVWVTGISARLLDGCNLTYWVRNGTSEIKPAIYCPDMGHAIVVHMLFGNLFRVCPRCEKTFAAEYPSDHYCSVKCREAHRVARFRARQKAKRSKQNVNL